MARKKTVKSYLAGKMGVDEEAEKNEMARRRQRQKYQKCGDGNRATQRGPHRVTATATSATYCIALNSMATARQHRALNMRDIAARARLLRGMRSCFRAWAHLAPAPRQKTGGVASRTSIWRAVSEISNEGGRRHAVHAPAATRTHTSCGLAPGSSTMLWAEELRRGVASARRGGGARAAARSSARALAPAC